MIFYKLYVVNLVGFVSLLEVVGNHRKKRRFRYEMNEQV